MEVRREPRDGCRGAHVAHHSVDWRARLKKQGVVVVGSALIVVAVGGSIILSMLGGEGDAMRVVTVGRSPLALAIDTRSGHIFVANYNDGRPPGTVSMLDATDGALRRTIPVGMFPRGVVVDEQRTRAFVMDTAAPSSSAKAGVSVIDTRSGQLRQQLPFNTTPTLLDIDPTAGRVFVGLPRGVGPFTSPPTGQIQTLDTTTGRRVRTVFLNFVPRASAVDERRGRLFLVGTGRGGVGYLAMLDTRNGRMLETTAVGVAPSVVAVDTQQDHVFVGDLGRPTSACAAPSGSCKMVSTVSMLDARNGHVLRTVGVGQNPLSMVIDQYTHRVFAVNRGNNQGDRGTVSVLDSRSGRVLQTNTVGESPLGAAVDIRHSHVYVANGNSGTVSIIDARNGRFLGNLRVAEGPLAVAVDERTDRVFVSSADVSDSIPMAYRPDRGIFDVIGYLGNALVRQARVLRKGRTGTVSMFDTRTVP